MDFKERLTEMQGYDLHEDIVVEILCRLPKKSLARFKCVCKQWRALISDGNRVFPKTTHLGFVCQSRGYINQSRTIFFFRVGSDGSASVAPSHLISIEQSCSLRSVCNGFLLFVKEGRRRWLEGEEYVVCHPATNRSWYLLPPVIRDTIHLGLASVDGRHFNLVRVFSVLGESSFATDVYSSRNECWIEDPWPPACGVPRYNSVIPERGNSVFLRGSLHWIWMNFLLIYHLEDGGACEILNLPQVPNRGSGIDPCDHCIWDSEGCLNYCCVYGHGRIGIWTLHRNIRSSRKCSNCSLEWKVKHKGKLGAPLMLTGRRHVACSPVAFNEEFAVVYLMSRRKVISYNIVTRECKEACISPFEGEKHARCIAFPFLYLTQFEIAAASSVGDDGKLYDASSGEMLKQRKLL